MASIKAASKDQIHDIRVSEVTVSVETPKPHPDLQAALKKELEAAMPVCAKGNADHSLNVVITDFEDQDVGKAIFLGDEIELKGRAEFNSVASGEQTGAYFLENSFAWGGFLGAAMMSDAEISLSKGFAENLCKEVFDVDLAQIRKNQN
ncbi:hypothetical protein AAFN88_17670 [Pelagibius sp. CAU 1746]|uniref:hypothetical protein n=1 Tax=Pelagibius sp. CAU 1746 TaxID=3140370 RepID=UPI00325B1CC0